MASDPITSWQREAEIVETVMDFIFLGSKITMLSRSVMLDALPSYGYGPPGSSVHGDSAGKSTGVDCHALLQGIFPIQELNPGLPYPLLSEPPGKPYILKSRDITLMMKVHLVKAMVFPVVMYRWELNHKEGWVPKNWCFQTVVLEKALESPLSNKETKPINSKGNQCLYTLEGLILNLKLQYFSHLMRRVDSMEKTPLLGKAEGKRRRGKQRMRW